MSERSASLIGGLSGIAALVLSIGGFALIGAAGFALQPDASRADVATALTEGKADVADAGLFLDTLGSLFLVMFAACLWARLRRAEGAAGWLALASFASALLMVAAGLGDKAAYYAIFAGADSGLDATVATALYDTATGFFVLFQALAGFFLLLTGAAAVRTGALRGWLGWAGVGVGAVSIASTAAPESGFGQLALPLVFAWIVAVAVTLLRAPAAAAT